MASSPTTKPIGRCAALLLVTGAAVFFNVTYFTGFPFLIFGYVICLVQLARLPKMRHAFYAGFLAGFLCFAPQLEFFWRIFGLPAIALWAILALWIALFVALTQAALARLGAKWVVLLAPFFWMGLEYFRSELYYLRFSWLNVGYAMAGVWQLVHFRVIGVYGLGFIAALIAAWTLVARPLWVFLACFAIFACLAATLPVNALISGPQVYVAGMQMEFPSEQEVLSGLDKLAAQCPDAQLLVLSEYTFTGPVPGSVRQWCRDHQKYLIAGGEDPAPGGNYYDTAFVIGPDGGIVFKQAKCEPIQFFNDGLPAQEQKVWDSPWGKIGICICYDLSYSRVTDRLMQLGARAIIVPTMDVEDWGKHEHRLHERVALVRAAEYGVPIFRVASSGISQLITSEGWKISTAPFAGSGEIISGGLVMTDGTLMLFPLDRVLAPVSVGVTACFILWLALTPFLRKISLRRKPGPVIEL